MLSTLTFAVFATLVGTASAVLPECPPAPDAVNIPSRETTIPASLYSFCTTMTSVTIPATVTSIGAEAFFVTPALETVTFETGSNLATIGVEAFFNSGLLTFTFPPSVTSIGDAAFGHCPNLVTVTFEPGSSLDTIGWSAFETPQLRPSTFQNL